MSKSILLKGGKVVCPAEGIEDFRDLLIKGNKISAVSMPGEITQEINGADESIDISGCLLAPGLIDIHVHLREPGLEWKETIHSGAKSAVAGGFTRLCCMPNTNPINDSAQVTEFILEKSKESGLAKVLPIAAISKGLKGESLSAMLELKEAGAVAFSDDGEPVHNASLMRKALEYGKMIDAVLTVHEEEKSLSDGFSMNESPLSVELGLKGMPEASENIMIARDIELSLLTGSRVHFCHVSTARGVELIRRAKADGARVTAETTPHYISLDESRVSSYDTNAKMSMPLRSKKDITALTEGLSDGTIDCLASDHAPHELDSKEVPFAEASLGIIGLQTTLPILLEKVREGKISLSRGIECLTSSAASCLNLEIPKVKEGETADLVVIDPEKSINFSKEHNFSLSNNSPYFGEKLQGLARYTFVNGKKVFDSKDIY